MKHRLFLAAAIAALATGAHAGPLTLTQTYGPVTTAPVTISAADTAVSGSVSQQGSTSVNAARFNTDMGILTGVKIRATAAAANQSLTVTGAGARNGGNRTAAGTGSGSLTVTSSASSGVSGPVNIGSLSCDTNANNNVPACPVSQSGGASATATLTAPAAALANYADGADFKIDITGKATADLTQLTNFLTGSASYDLTLGNIGVAVDYDYYAHADPSLSATVLDFGTVAQGALAADLLLDIANTGGFGAANLALVSIMPSGAFDAFSAAFPLFSGLAPGQTLNSLWSFDTSTAGMFEALYTLVFSDALPDGVSGIGARTYTRSFTLRGIVEPVAAPVPEPGALGLLGLGLAALALRRRKKVTA